jgi:hypothetical protein
VTTPFASGVFISYRRSDAGPYARLLQVQLSRRLPGTPVFMDLDSIDAGADFAEAIESGVQSCRALVALIGPRWVTVSDEQGRRRLDDPDDYVRLEIRTALERCARVIPVLVDDATMPQRQQLPDDLAKLARLNALRLSCDRYPYDEGRLVTIIRKALATESTDTPSPTASPPGTAQPAAPSQRRRPSSLERAIEEARHALGWVPKSERSPGNDADAAAITNGHTGYRRILRRGLATVEFQTPEMLAGQVEGDHLDTYLTVEETEALAGEAERAEIPVKRDAAVVRQAAGQIRLLAGDVREARRRAEAEMRRQASLRSGF